MRPDLNAAGIDYVDDTGRYADFHALRHSFITHLGRTKDIHFKTAQDLARHSTPMLTARYTHGFKGDEVTAVNALPDFGGGVSGSEQATGTNDATPGPAHLARSLAQNHGKHETDTDSDGLNGECGVRAVAHENPRQTREERGFDGESGEGGIRTLGRRNTPYAGLANRCQPAAQSIEDIVQTGTYHAQAEQAVSARFTS